MHHFKVAVVFLACVGVTSSSSVFTLSSIYRPGRRCNTSLVSIDTNRCTNSSGRRQCPLNWEGFTSSNSTHFQIKGQGEGLKCIQVDNKGVHYALKVIQKGSKPTLVFEEHRCSSATDEAFIFKVKHLRLKHRLLFAYQPANTTHTPMCIGATGGCSESLPQLIRTPSINIIEDRKCRFIRHKT